MRIKYNVLFAPSGVDPENVREVREVEIYNNDRFESHEKLKKKARREAISSRSIDRYAMRNDYWSVACCELTVVDSPWEDTRDLSTYLRDNYDIVSISKVRNTWSNSSVECLFNSTEDREQAQKKVENAYPNLPVANRRKYLRITIRAKGNIDISDFEDTKPIFEIAGMK